MGIIGLLSDMKNELDSLEAMLAVPDSTENGPVASDLPGHYGSVWKGYPAIANLDEGLPDLEEEGKTREVEILKSSFRAAKYFSYPMELVNPYLGVMIRRVPPEVLRPQVLGRAFPSLGLVEIRNDLYGNDFEEVKLHELMHMSHPSKSEYEIRQLTRMALPFSPRFH